MLPFHINRLWGLKTKTHGFALVSEEGIRLVFRDTADIASAPDEEADSLLINWQNFVRMTAKRGLLCDRLSIEVHALPDASPDGDADNLIELELQKRDRDTLDRFERDVEAYRSGRKRDDVDEVLDDVRDFLEGM